MTGWTCSVPPVLQAHHGVPGTWASGRERWRRRDACPRTGLTAWCTAQIHGPSDAEREDRALLHLPQKM